MNDAPPAIDDLISRHFDEALPPADHQRLMEALNADPGARLNFAATARLHASLEALAPALPPVRKRRLPHWVLATAAAVLVIGGGMALLNLGEQSHTRITLEDTNGSPDGAPEKPRPHGLTRRVVKSPSAALAEGGPALDMDRLLSGFFVNVSPDGLTVPEALARLETAIQEANVMNRPGLDQLSFTAGRAISPMPSEGVNGPMIHDPVVHTRVKPPMTVRQFLNHCATINEIEQQPGGKRYPEVYLHGKVTMEDFEGYFARLRGLAEISNRGDGDSRSFSISARLINGPRSLLPQEFAEETGLVLKPDGMEDFLEALRQVDGVSEIAPPDSSDGEGKSAVLEPTGTRPGEQDRQSISWMLNAPRWGK